MLPVNRRRPVMYTVVHVSSGIVAVSFSDRQYALAWIADNNYLLDEPANLYKLIKAKS